MNQVRVLGGLRIESQIALTGLGRPDAHSGAFGCVSIRRVDIDELSARARGDAQAMRFSPAHLGSFLVCGDGEILVAARSDAPLPSIIAFIFGPCFAVIAYRHRCLPLHAGSVDTAAGCVAFAGSSGAGKSTLVGALAARGYAIRSDDVCFLRSGDDGRALSWPGIRWLRLTTGSADALGYAQRPAAGAYARKHSLPLPALPQPGRPRPLQAIYVLEAARGDAAPNIVRLQGLQAAGQVIGNIYRPNLLERQRHWAEIVLLCARIAASVPVYRLRRPLSFSQLARTLDLLERHIIDPHADHD